MKPSTSLYHQTPNIGVYDNRGLLVRGLRYNRSVVDSPLQELIIHSSYSLQGFALQSTDPRLFARQQQGEDVQPNMQVVYSLTGQSLKTDSVDAGSSWQMLDIEGRVCWGQDSNTNQRWQQYDILSRINLVIEQPQGETARNSERFIYGSDKTLNQNSLVIHYYDTAGLLSQDSFSLLGMPLNSNRQLLADMDNASDWQGDDEAAWQALLDTENYQTHWQYNATGAITQQTDAKGNQQRWTLDIAGRLSAHWMTLQGGTEQQVVGAIDYSAAGQILSETAGNGVITQYSYEVETQRLLGVTTLRSGNTTVCDLRYEYDPVGNVTLVTDLADEVRFYKNRRVAPENAYAYDALYQLIDASGRQNNTLTQQGSALPAPIIDASNLVTYSRSYRYDTAGNMTQFSHNSEQSFTTEMVVANNNNRALLQTGGIIPDDIDAGFDTRGNTLNLQPGQPLRWDIRNQLQQVTLVQRTSDDDSDWERYYYTGNHQRIIKKTQLNSGQNNQQVIYLPGLEIRTTMAGETITEQLDILTISAGSFQLRILSWEIGGEESIKNPQWRYSTGNLINSQNIEFDGVGNILTIEEFFPFGGTAIWAGNSSEVKYKYVRYSGKELDSTGLYYYGHRYYIPWSCRWLSTDPAGTVDGLNLYCMVNNNPISYADCRGLDKIPMIIHYIWIGDNVAGLNKFEKNIINCAELNPHYKIMLHLDVDKNRYGAVINRLSSATNGAIEIKDIPTEEYYKANNSNADVYEKLKSGGVKYYAFACDTLRYTILNHFGGIYNDLDNPPTSALPKKPFDIQNNQLLTGFITVIDSNKYALWNNCYFASLPNENPLTDLKEHIATNFLPETMDHISKVESTIDAQHGEEKSMVKFELLTSTVGVQAFTTYTNLYDEERNSAFKKFNQTHLAYRSRVNCLPREERKAFYASLPKDERERFNAEREPIHKYNVLGEYFNMQGEGSWR